ncbi:FkbM family methyltransferase [Sulfurimonas sp.]
MLKKILKLKDFYTISEIFTIAVRELLYFFKRNIFKNEYLMAKVYSYKMFIPLRDEGIGKVLYIRGERELDHRYIMEEEIKSGDVIFDLGANIGYYALMEDMLMEGNGKIYAIEPDYRNIEVFKKNLELNSIKTHVEVFEGAISDTEGEEEFYLADKTNLNTFNITEGDKYEKVKVKVFEFKEFLKDIDTIDLVRMDIEGHEVEVFNSLVKLLNEFPEKAPKKIVFETHKPKYTDEHDIRPALEKLFSNGYYPKTITTAHEEYSELHALGYQPKLIIKDFPFERGIYKNISKEDTINLISNLGSVRTVLIERDSNV